jgi:hypothetical protein
VAPDWPKLTAMMRMLAHDAHAGSHRANDTFYRYPGVQNIPFCTPQRADTEILTTAPNGGYVRASIMDRSHTK